MTKGDGNGRTWGKRKKYRKSCNKDVSDLRRNSKMTYGNNNELIITNSSI